jgi:hypothetical protein
MPEKLAFSWSRTFDCIEHRQRLQRACKSHPIIAFGLLRMPRGESATDQKAMGIAIVGAGIAISVIGTGHC